MTIKVVVHGASGRLGHEIIKGLCREPGIQVVGAVRRIISQDPFLLLPSGLGKVPLSNNLEKILNATNPDVVVDSSIAEVTMSTVPLIISKGIRVIIATTGLKSGEIEEIRQLAQRYKVGVVLASNFAIGAVLMMHLSKIAAKYMEQAEILEQHHHLKVDAPSGTALSTAKIIGTNHDGIKSINCISTHGSISSRGQIIDEVIIHSTRLPGLMAHQEVLFSSNGETLSIRHDTINRECYIPGIVLAVKEIGKYQGFIKELNILMGLKET